MNKITEIKANPKAKNEGLKLKEVQDKMAEANQFLSDNSSKYLFTYNICVCNKLVLTFENDFQCFFSMLIDHI